MEQTGKKICGEVQDGLSQLQLEIVAYKGLTEEEIERIIQDRCIPIVKKRDNNSIKFIAMVSNLLDLQSKDWWGLMKRIRLFKLKISALFKWYQQEKCSTQSGMIRMYARAQFGRTCGDTADHLSKIYLAGVRIALKQARIDFEQTNTELEGMLQEAIAAVATCSSEISLDEKVAQACKQLDKIEEGYRLLHANSVSILDQYPKSAGIVNREYEGRLLSLLSLQMEQTNQEDSCSTNDENTTGKCRHRFY